MKPTSLRLFGLLLLVYFCGCSSLSKDAKSLMEKGDFADAVTTWDQVLKSDPHDEEAQRLRKVSQNELMNVDLVTLKGLLDSHQTLGAFDHLRKLNETRKNWNLGINPNSAQYLKQQTERLYGQYLELIDQEIGAKHPLKAKLLEKHYRDLLPSEIAPEEQSAKNSIAHEGVRQCDELETNSRTHDHLRIFAISFCKVFGKLVTLSSANQSRMREKLLQLPPLTATIQGFNENDNRVFSHALTQTFAHAPEFSSFGTQEAKVNFTGVFAQNQNVHEVPMSHSYTIQIPYIEYRTVTNHVSEPYSSSENRCDAKGTHCWTQSVTLYRDVEHTDTVSETAFRSEPHVYTFNATKLEESIQFNLQSNLKSPILSLSIPFQDRFDETELSHRENLPDIGLTPQIKTLKTKEQWLVDELPKVASQLDNQLQETWIQKHCQAQAKLARWQIADHVFECLRSSRATKESFVNSWFLSETGLSPEETFELAGPLSYL